MTSCSSSNLCDSIPARSIFLPRDRRNGCSNGMQLLTVPIASARLALVRLTRKRVSSPLHHSAPFFASRVPILVYCFRLCSHHWNRIRRHAAETPAKLNRILRTSCRHLHMQRLGAGRHGMSGLSLVMLHSMGINLPYVCFITMSFDQETKPMVSMMFAAVFGAVD